MDELANFNKALAEDLFEGEEKEKEKLNETVVNPDFNSRKTASDCKQK